MKSDKNLVLAVNAGSSSLKASVLRGESQQHVLHFQAERLGTANSVLHVEDDNGSTNDIEEANLDHDRSLELILSKLKEEGLMDSLVAVGHRVVHGGPTFTDSVVIDDDSLDQIAQVSHLAPLHNPHNVAAIQTCRAALPKLLHVAVFDTSFHSTLPAYASTYPLPQEYREAGVRKYGFHGTSVRYVMRKATKVLQMFDYKPTYNMLVCHLGNGASVTAVSGDQSLETTMGFSPLPGLMMGSRCGDVDPTVVSFACKNFDKDVDTVFEDLNKRSGLKGMTNDGDNDMRTLLERIKRNDDDNEPAKLAVEMFVYRLAQHMASCLVALPDRIDAIVFTAGIGEHSAEIRSRCLERLRHVVPVELDPELNRQDGTESQGVLSKPGSWPVCLDVPTDEEAEIANECRRLSQ